MMRPLAAVLTAATLYACQGATEAPSTPDGSWVGTITTEGNVTTVVNESGSVWGGTARLIEEVSIGVEDGDDPYMFGEIHSLWATDREIFVLDSQVPAIRVYDYDGVYRRDIGAIGEGPGEYGRPFSIGGDASGRLFVADVSNGRVTVFSVDGLFIDAWPAPNMNCCILPMVVTTDGVPYLSVRHERRIEAISDFCVRAFGKDGARGPLLCAPELETPDHTFRVGDRHPPAVFAPEVVWSLALNGDVIAGASHEYRFEIRGSGDGVTVVERDYQPVDIVPEERDWWRRYYIAIFRRRAPGWTWDGAQIPNMKPAFTRFWPTAGGDIWAIRLGPGVRLPECDASADVNDRDAFEAASCWRDTELVDVFGADGRFLGELEVPDEVNLRFALPWVSDDTVIASYYDENGTIMVKRYRLVRPGKR